jgi:MEMO1 family protein
MWVADAVEAMMEKASRRMKIRPPAAAGLFYAANPDRLRTTVCELLAEVQPAGKVLPKALIAPHAGYVYSGRVAAEAFATLRASAQSIVRVVLIGPAHFVAVRGIAAPTVDAFETPLGCVPVDRDALSAIADLPFVIAADAPHAPEHSLEVELPFLQALLPNFAVVPLVIGDAVPQEVAEVLRRLWGGPQTLIVVSSDLSHYHDYDTAHRLDAATAAAIERGDWESLGPNQACGFLAVAGLLVEAAPRRLTPQRLSLCNSGDTAGSRDSVVGYGAWMVEQAGAAA